MSTKTTLSRDSYGSLYQSNTTSDRDRLFFSTALMLVQIAANSKKIPLSFDNMMWAKSKRPNGKKIGEALHHEIYDISADGRTVLVCARTVSGSHYGQKTTGKDYFLVRAHGTGTRVITANKAVAAKSAKSAGNTLGAAIEVCTGKNKLSVPARKIRTGFKALACVDDKLCSI